MSHEKGIEAASDYFDSFEHMMLEHSSKEAVFQIVKAYLDASGMVMVPREPTPEMIAAAWASWKVRHPKPIGPGPGFVESISASIAAYPKQF